MKSDRPIPLKATILIVDDEPNNRFALAQVLAELEETVVEAESGEDALRFLLREECALILLDAHMPGMDGFETAGHVKQRERTRHIPILFLTAVDYDPHLAFRGYQAGAVDYITKPFDPWVLRSKVAVFVDLWTTHTQLADRAGEVGALRSAIDDALELLDGGAPDDVARARARLAGVRGGRG